MARKQANPTLVMLVQQLRPELWGHLGADPVVAEGFAEVHRALETMPEGPERIAYMQQVAAWLGGLVAACWEADGRKIADCHAVLHDLDTVNAWDEAAGSTVEVAKELHMHLLVKFATQASSASVDKLAALVGVEPQYLGLDKSRGGSAVEVCGKKVAQQHDNGLSYLTHAKYPEKHQYRPEQVATVRGSMPYEQVYAERYGAWVRGRAHVVKKRAAENAEHLREMVLQGEVTKAQIMLTDELYEVYTRNARIIDEALSIYGQRRAYKAADKLRRGEFQTTVIYIWGQSEHGKTHLAKKAMAQAMELAAQRGERWELYRAATANPLDDWCGEEVVFLDEARSSTMDAQDWLLLLDPNNASPARARYRNKAEVAPRLVVMTCTIEPVTFFYYTRQKGALDEALDQFMRRLAAVVHAQRVGDEGAYSYHYDTARVGPVPRYQREFENRGAQRQLGPGSEMTTLDLNFGPRGELRHGTEAATGVVVGELVQRSPDLRLGELPEWLGMAEVVAYEEKQLALEEIEQAESVSAAAEIEAEEEAALADVIGALDPVADRPAIRSLQRTFGRRWNRHHSTADLNTAPCGIVPPGY